ncbi:hypothetical protein ACFWP5_08805 [Streptomyces sp. NPDC058469]|uniref:hypothetical protein n=1 Tax=Streptomyces sp. NPDC058469 TaxID=3346514 RepID=UPI003654C418
MGKFRIQRVKASLTILNTTTTIVSAAIPLNGLLRGIIVAAPDLSSTNTYAATVKDVDGYTVYTKAALVKNTTTAAFIDANNQPLQLPLSGDHTITLTSSGTEGADRVFSVTLLIDRG